MNMAAQKLSRHQMRQSAFMLTFERIFNDAPIEELLEAARECEAVELNDQAIALFQGVDAKKEELDQQIQQYLKNWTLSRISKVALAVLRVAMYEMFYSDDMEDDVVISEAVKIAQEFTGREDVSFINGVLSSAAKARKQ